MSEEIYRLHAQGIENTLATYKIQSRVWQATVTPRFVRYAITTALGTRVNDVSRLAAEIAQGLGVADVRIYRDGGQINVEVPKAKPTPVNAITVCTRLDGAIPEATALLGVDGDGAPLMLHLPSPDVAHVLISGTTGSGKTELLRTMLASLMLRNPVEKLQMILIDPKGRLAEYADLPHVRGVAQNPAEIAGALRYAAAEMDRRGPGAVYPRLIIAIDELADVLTTTPSAAEAIERLTQRGREAGIHIIAATQRPSALQVGGATRANLPTRLVGRVVSPEEAKIASGLAGTGAEKLMGRGDFLLVACGQQERFQAGYINGDGQRLREMLAATGAPVLRKLKFAEKPQIEPVPTGAPVQEPPIAEDYTARAVLPRHDRGPTPAEAGRIRAAYDTLGSLNAAVAWAYGSKSPLTLNWVKRALEAT